MEKNYATVLEFYLIAEEGIFDKVVGKFKKTKTTGSQRDNMKYFNFLNTVLEKIPTDIVAKEKALRKKEWSAIQSIVKKRNTDDYLPRFLSCTDFEIFETDVIKLLSYIDNDDDTFNEDAVYSEFDRISDAINANKLKFFNTPHSDWNGNECVLYLDVRPSTEFMEAARKFGYVSHENYFKNN